MIDSDGINLCNFQLVRPKLTPKIIQLRKISQENHVRRMKIAHQMKEIQTPQDMSLFITPISRCNSTSFRTPFTTPRRVCESHSIQSLKVQASKTASVKSSHNCSTPNVIVTQREKNNSDTKLDDFNKSRNFCKDHKDSREYNTSIGDPLCKISSGNQTPDVKSNTSSAIKSGNKSSPSLGKISGKLNFESGERTGALDPTNRKQSSELNANPQNKVQDSPFGTCGPNFSNSKSSKMLTKDITGKSNDTMQPDIFCERKCSSTSKIPVALSRLSRKKGSKKASSTPKKHHKFQESSDNSDSINSMQEKILNESSKSSPKLDKDDEIAVESNEKESETFAPVITSSSVEHFPDAIGDGHLFDEETILTPSKRSSVSNWLNNILDGGKLAKNHTCEYEGSPHENETYTISSYDSKSQTPTKSAGEDFNLPSSESDDTEKFYDTTEIESEVFSVDLNTAQKDWREKSVDDEDKSSISVPSDKDLDLQDHRASFFRELPDYPNTPYYLRYPRYNIKRDENVISSGGKEMADALRQLRIGKAVKKSAISTPRKKKNGKNKNGTKGKKHLFGMKYHV